MLVPAHVRAQGSVERLRQRCVELGGSEARCGNVAIGARATASDLTLLAGLGSEVPGSASTLGRRIGSQPRFAFSFRAAGLSLGQPDLLDSGGGLTGERSSFASALHVGLAAGILDGFSPLPTVGGLFSLDLLLSGSMVFLPSSDGFRDDARALSVGGRLGILRESFTLPGVSVSVSRRFVEEVGLGDLEAGASARLALDPSMTSVRATVGKDLFGLGVLGGIGWERGSADVSADLGASGDGILLSVEREVDLDRTLYFGGLSWNFLLLQLSVEGGWIDGFDRPQGLRVSEFDAGDGSFFGSVAVRFTP